MELNEYQRKAMGTAVFPDKHRLTYPILGLVGEAGELANKHKKVLRGDYSWKDIKGDLAKELGDVLWYVAAVADSLEIELDDVAHSNLRKLAKRKKEGTIKGTGDER